MIRSATDRAARSAAEAEAAELRGTPLAALVLYEQSLHVYPFDDVTATNMGVLAKHLGKIDAARAALRHAQAMDPSRAVTHVQRLLDGGGVFGEAEGSRPALLQAAQCLCGVLREAGYSASLARRLLLAQGGSAGGAPTGAEYFELRLQPEVRDALEGEGTPQPLGTLFLLFLLGAAVPLEKAAAAIGKGPLTRLIEMGLLVSAPVGKPRQFVASPVQVYPLDMDDEGRGDGATTKELLIATDWSVESLLPTKYAVMPIGVDSLDLVHLAPREACACVLDLCCGSGIQALVAASSYASKVVAADVNRRAVRFTTFNAELNAVSHRVEAVVSDTYSHPLIDENCPFDAILANPPFVAVPASAAPVHECCEWALYADGGPDGARVYREIVRGADVSRLRPGGWLCCTGELPNVSWAHEWLPVNSLEVTVCYNPLHVQTVDEYAAVRAEERPDHASSANWAEAMRSHGVKEMGNAFLFGLQLHPGSEPTGRSIPFLGGPDSEWQSLLSGVGASVRRSISDSLCTRIVLPK
mmetsp:Transcript_1504/g.3830  ORF Transcript_1504/g.3830 Transcript_1504/m.3830 type:complete len:527 (+) Transcript_1504:33-1613(+)